jgi:hypothetical protein
MNVGELKKILEDVDQDLPVYFSYDSRVCVCDFNIIDVETDLDDNKRSLVFRAEDDVDYEFLTKYALEKNNLTNKSIYKDFSDWD